ncbi:14579_t:CDS:2, partial [Acaulospora colombiana]
TLPSLPDLHERIRAISAEHGLQLKPSSSRTFTRLFNQALEDILVKIITSTLTTITRSDSQYESIQPPARPMDSDPFSSRHNNNKDFQWPKEEEEVQPKGQINLSAKPIADYYRLVRASRSGGPVLLQEFPTFQMDSNPWGNAWAQPSKETVQEVVVKPKEESWLTSPASGDIGVAWSTQWESQADGHTTWHPQESSVASLGTPWN